MRHASRSRPAIAWVILGVQVLAVSGCHSWQTQTGSAQAVLAAQPGLTPDSTAYSRSGASATAKGIRIATTDHPGMRTLNSPYMARDSLFWLMKDSRDEVGVPLNSVTTVQVRKPSPGKTVGLVVGLTAAVAVTVGVIAYCDVVLEYGC